MRPAAWAVLALGVAAGCGGGKAASTGPDVADFECSERKIEYAVVGGFVADEAGIRMDCDGGKPIITRWRLESSGERKSEHFDLSGEQFDSTWEKIEATGWRFLDETCDNPGANKKKDPVYSIDVSDGSTSVSLSCTGKELPFPYDRLVNELDLRAAGFGDDSGPAR